MRLRSFVWLVVLLPLPAASSETTVQDGEAVVSQQAPDAEPAELVAASVEDDPDAALTGREIYERVLANRHRTIFQKQEMISTDAGGGSYTTELWTRWKDGRDEEGRPVKGTISKTLSKYTKPSNVRGVGYLIVQKDGRSNDQFVYFPSAKRVRRVSLGDSIMGTDFTIEDIVPREIETSDYERAADSSRDGVPCFVIYVVPKPDSGSQYSKLEVHVEKEHYVPIYTRYWSHDEVEIKHYATKAADIELVDGVWLTRHGTMTDVVESSATTLNVLEIEPNAKIKDSLFSVRTLEQRSR